MCAIVGRSRSTAASRSSVRSHVTQLTMSKPGSRPDSPRPAARIRRVLDAVRAAQTADHDAVGDLAGDLEHARARAAT